MAIDGTISRSEQERRLVLAERLPPDTRAPAVARHLVSAALGAGASASGASASGASASGASASGASASGASGSGLDGALDETLLMVSELVTNACIHTASEITIHLYANAGGLRVEVIDGGELPPVLEDWDGRVGGLGLQLVDHLADRWGWQPARDGGKVVWFERRTQLVV